MTRPTTKKLIETYGIISDQVDKEELYVVLEECLAISHIEGAVVEFGCYIGTTSVYLRRILDELNKQREFHVYDSFEGLPEKRTEDHSPLGEQFVAGELHVTKKQLLHEFKKARLRLPTIHKGWFRDVRPDEVPEPIAFAFLDGDYYESIMTPLLLITPKLANGATIVVDDYTNQALPGAAKAVDTWCAKQGYSVQVIHSLAVIRT